VAQHDPEIVPEAGECGVGARVRTPHAAPLRDPLSQQTLRLVVAAEIHVDDAERV
jgi:hypothetical protein